MSQTSSTLVRGATALEPAPLHCAIKQYLAPGAEPVDPSHLRAVLQILESGLGDWFGRQALPPEYDLRPPVTVQNSYSVLKLCISLQHTTDPVRRCQATPAGPVATARRMAQACGFEVQLVFSAPAEHKLVEVTSRA